MSGSAPETPWAVTASEVAAGLGVDPRRGLSAAEARRRLERHGPNRLRARAARARWRAFVDQFADLMIGILALAALLSALIGEIADAVVIGVIVLANALIGFVQEQRAERALEALRSLTVPLASVRRDDRIERVEVAALVPGDVVELVAGDRVPADARLLEAAELSVDAAALTGESLAVSLSTDPVAPDAALGDRHSMVHAGCTVVAGHARALVTATGMRTELGTIASLLDRADSGPTPLQQRLNRLARRLALVVAAICLAIVALGLWRVGLDGWTRTYLAGLLLTAVSLAVAAIPEGLPAVITVTLALGSQRMAAVNAVVRRLAGVETLGSVDVICSDKTGTLTENRMTVAAWCAVGNLVADDRELIAAAVLCNDAQRGVDDEVVGDPTEVALYRSARDRDIDPERLRAAWPRLDEHPFSSQRKRMSTVHRAADGTRVVYVKGAAEAVIQHCGTAAGGRLDDDGRAGWLAQGDAQAALGRRVLAVARRELATADRIDAAASVECDLTLLGLVAIVDPPRGEVPSAIATCARAGVRVVMITGDHAATAAAIAEEIGLSVSGEIVVTGRELDALSESELEARVDRIAVYARVAPEHKLSIVRALQARGRVVAMTGDGVNDAPALKQADIGVAMGCVGTDAAKQAAEIVLTDDNFATIVAAVEQGRIAYDNIRKFVGYLLAANTGEVLVLLAALLAGMPLPLLPIHILWINLVTDGLPALALGFEQAEPDVMRRPPRGRNERLLDRAMIVRVVGIGALMAAVCLSLYLSFGASDSAADELAYARTVVFVTLSFLQLNYVFAVRSERHGLLRIGLLGNRRLIGAVAAGAALQLAVVYVPALQGWFHTVALRAGDLALCLGASLAALIALESVKWLTRLRERMT